MSSVHRIVATVAALAAVFFAAPTLGRTPAAGASPTLVANTSCPPIAAAQLHAILGFPNSLQARNTTDDSGGATDYLCNGVAWSGPAPTSFNGALQTAKSGHAAGFGIEAWQPDESSQDVEQWKSKDFLKLRDEMLHGYVSFPGAFTNLGWPTKRIDPLGFGHAAVGVVITVGSGPAKGLVAAVGCWWDNKAFTGVCLLDEEAAGKPVVTHLNALAKIVVPKVL
jgi:hypothetical protein